jgi:hypothetical protein
MPVDSRDKRSSALMLALPWRGMLPAPDVGAEDQGDRQHVALMYRGILASAPPVGGGVTKKRLLPLMLVGH